MLRFLLALLTVGLIVTVLATLYTLNQKSETAAAVKPQKIAIAK